MESAIVTFLFSYTRFHLFSVSRFKEKRAFSLKITNTRRSLDIFGYLLLLHCDKITAVYVQLKTVFFVRFFAYIVVVCLCYFMSIYWLRNDARWSGHFVLFGLYNVTSMHYVLFIVSYEIRFRFVVYARLSVFYCSVCVRK